MVHSADCNLLSREVFVGYMFYLSATLQGRTLHTVFKKV